jgi:oligosaccharide repeat unit polymerase
VDVPFSINVYTALHPPFKDFGIMGVIVAFAVIGAASTYFYLRAAAGEQLHVFYYSLSLSPLLFMTFSDQYFAPMLSWLKYAAAGYLYFSTAKRRPSATVQGGAAQRLNPTLER